ncbi:MAG TPA: ABC transporter permease [Gemmatimonadaceae bacterium]|nr:ABC transporter permease [Gemmatimonadaceae bacterium]
MDTLVQDVRFALRSLRKSWSFTLVVVVCLGLGTGATTAIFTVVNAVVLRPLPYPEPEQLVRLYDQLTIDKTSWIGAVPSAIYLDWRRQNTVFEQLVAYDPGSMNLASDGPPERLMAVRATVDLFAALRVKAALGRGFLPSDGKLDAPAVAVLSDALWRSRFGADRAILGRTITLDGAPYTVIGVTPPAFTFPATKATEVWVPRRFSPEESSGRGNQFVQVVGRLKPTVTLAAARAQIGEIAARLTQEYPDAQSIHTVRLLSMYDDLFGRVRPRLLVLLGASVLVLLVACVNVANLLLARATARRREVAVRSALGARRGHLVRQFLTESLMLSLAGAAIGLVIANLGVRTLMVLASQEIPGARLVSFDLAVFAFLLAVALFTGIGFGLVPALSSTSVDPREGLADGGRLGSASRAQQRFRAGLVAVELALAVMLTTGAGLLLKAFVRLEATPVGLTTDHVLTLHVSAPAAKYQRRLSEQFYRPVLERVAALPGVTAAGWISLLPLQEYWSNGNIAIEGRPPAPRGQEPFAEYRWASADCFTALRIPILKGRNFSDRDAPVAPPVVIINEALAHKYFPHENPIGRRLVLDSLRLAIVGVIGNVRGAGLDQQPMPEIYFSYRQVPEYIPNTMTLVVRTNVPPTSLTSGIRGAVEAVDPAQPIYNVETMEQVLSESLSNRRLYLWLLVTFAGIALVLAAAGVYGVTSHLVTQRTREIGIRMAIGAEAASLVRLVLREGAKVAALGTLLGLVGAYGLTRLLSSLLYGVSATDSAVFGGVAALLAAVSFVACYVPARRATGIDPTIALRSE